MIDHSNIVCTLLPVIWNHLFQHRPITVVLAMHDLMDIYSEKGQGIWDHLSILHGL